MPKPLPPALFACFRKPTPSGQRLIAAVHFMKFCSKRRGLAALFELTFFGDALVRLA